MTTLGTKTNEEWTELLTGELLLFGLLGKLFYTVPEHDLIAPLVAEDIFADAPFAGQRDQVRAGLALLQQWCRAFAQEPQTTLRELQVDYTRLFVVTEPLPVTPWESVYLNDERLLFQASTVDVRRWYLRFGLETARVQKEPEDHIGLELAFIAHLARSGLEAVAAADEAALTQALVAQRGFCREHLLVWAPLWCEQMVEFARTPFYRGLAMVLHGALDELEAQLEAGAA